MHPHPPVASLQARTGVAVAAAGGDEMAVQIEVSPFHRADLSLAGLLLHGRWPDSVGEWSQVLALAVRIG